MKSHVTQIIVMNEQKYGDSSKILRAFSRDLGKVSIMAKGALRPKSSLVSVSSQFAWSDICLSEGKSFYYIKWSRIIKSNFELRKNFKTIIYASFIMELLDKTFLEGEVNRKVFDLVVKAINLLPTFKNPELFLLAYEIKFISFLGYRPNLLTDSYPAIFSIEDGGIIKDHERTGTYGLDQKDIYYLNKILYTSLDKLDLKIDSNRFKVLQDILIKYIKYNLDIKEFNSLLLIE
ncbi:DNA repair protein RecO [Peptoniphilus catoniae]|uniref:DNA repair protein RecO n=1 Tax=Peptoniphilus catoniae TaxID=1660341 RepID=UPI0010FD8305|nr:DNA repair protein RecO [Peptoniphilus catoniae]